MKTIAIMQPYFAPYAGYFRLMQRADVFVVYDCVQFPRRGYVHRNRFATASDALDWASLPLKKAPRDVLIRDLEFADDAVERWAAQTARFPALKNPPAEWAALFQRMTGPAAPWIEDTLRLLSDAMGLSTPFVRSSSVDIAQESRGQDRILAICRALGATRYVNAPGGRDLYDGAAFAGAGVALEFLAPYDGPMESALERLLRAPEDLRAEFLDGDPGNARRSTAA